MGVRTAEEFYRAVKLMREAQKHCLKANSPMARNAAARQEGEVDRFIAERDRRLAEQEQKDLFGGKNNEETKDR